MTVYCPACLELSRKNEKSWPQALLNSEFYVSLQSQMNMVPIVQLVRASDCGSECRRFESDWAPFQKSLKFLNFRDFSFFWLSSFVPRQGKFCFVILMLYICDIKYGRNMDTIAIDRKQTAFRLRKDLLERLKIEARKENRSLNNYVESVLLDAVYREPNEETLAAMEEAREGKNLTKVDTSSLESFLKSLE